MIVGPTEASGEHGAFATLLGAFRLSFAGSVFGFKAKHGVPDRDETLDLGPRELSLTRKIEEPDMRRIVGDPRGCVAEELGDRNLERAGDVKNGLVGRAALAALEQRREADRNSAAQGESLLRQFHRFS
jgi:hypothetical protein